MKLSMLLILFTCCYLTVNSQVVNIPDKAKEHFKENFKNATDPKWDNDVTNYKCKFKEGGVAKTAHYNVDGNWTYTETWIAESDIPAPTKDTFSKSKYRSWKSKGVAYIENSDSEKYYRYAVKKGIETKYVFIDKDGKVIKRIPVCRKQNFYSDQITEAFKERDDVRHSLYRATSIPGLVFNSVNNAGASFSFTKYSSTWLYLQFSK